MDDSAKLETLERLFKAFNAHDAQAVMACFAPHAVFHAAAGAEANGRRFEGQAAIEAAFVAVWTDLPDVAWSVHRSRLVGNEAITEWLFTGTRKNGTRIEAEGLDLFSFEGALVATKSAFRKDRPALAKAA